MVKHRICHDNPWAKATVFLKLSLVLGLVVVCLELGSQKEETAHSLHANLTSCYLSVADHKPKRMSRFQF